MQEQISAAITNARKEVAIPDMTLSQTKGEGLFARLYPLSP